MAVDIPGFRLGIYVFKDAEIVDFAALAEVARVMEYSEAYALYREDLEM